VPADAEMLDTLGRIDPFTMSQQEGRSQWFERLSRARVTQQPLCVPGGAVVIWRMDLAWAVAELLQLRAYREHHQAKDGTETSLAARNVLAERQRQVNREGYSHENDDAHILGELGAYAAFYAMPPAARDWPAEGTGYGATWGEAIVPWNWAAPKPGDRRGELVKAGALILAEIERLDRAIGSNVVRSELNVALADAEKEIEP
jgi:hypothetical protein